MFPKFDQFNLLLVARFADLKLLYDIELGKPLRKAYNLSDKILSPTNIEKTNVMLADGLFHESTINATSLLWQERRLREFPSNR